MSSAVLSPMEQGEIDSSPILIHSPDIEILPDDEAHYSPRYRRRSSHDKDDNEEALDIKPPQVNLSKKDKHKHKHKEDRKRERDKERSRHGEKDRERGKHRERREKEKVKESYEDRLARERERERERERQRRKETEDSKAEAKRREKSQRERDRLEMLERERRKLERETEREHREREHKERLKQEQERLAKAEREQERLAKAEREQERLSKAAREQERLMKTDRSGRDHMTKSSREKPRQRGEPEERRKTHITRQEVEKRRDRDKDRHRSKKDIEHSERSRSRSPYLKKESRSRYESRQDNYYQQMHKYDEPVEREHGEEEEEEEDHVDSQLETLYQSQTDHDPHSDHYHAHSEHQPLGEHHPHSEQDTSSESSNGTDSEDTDTDSADTESEESNRSHRSVSEAENSGTEYNHQAEIQSGKLRSKFDDDQDMTTLLESPPPSDTEEEGEEEEEEGVEDGDYLDHTPPESPIELAPLLPPYFPAIQGCRNVEEFHCLNRIEEGTYGVVYRARDNKTNELVALKRLKMEKEKEGFPITSLREINTLLKAQHPNIVTVREIVVGSNMDKIYIVMDYVEHDLKSLMQVMKDPFIIGEVKTLMQQLLRGVAHLHDNWIIHRDLKTSNLLLSHNGILKIGDFGLAREYGSPLKPYTSIVVTLWYRAPELLLGIKEYSTYIDMWSVGCIFAEFLNMKPLFPGKSEIDELNRIFKDLGTPNEKIWPGVSDLPVMKKCTFAEYPYNQLRKKFSSLLTDKGFDLMNRFLTYDPQRRITAREALQHMYFTESPLPVSPSMFPTWPAKSEQAPRVHGNTPRPPSGGKAYAKLLGDDDEALARGFHIGASTKGAAASTAFALKF